MTVRVRLFALLRERTGAAEFALELPDGASVSQARAAILGQFPAVRDLVDRCRYAVNQSYETSETVLRDGDELALIPPVSGG